MKKRYVIGFGTGRCGTVTLAKIISNCFQCNVSHEFRERGTYHRLSWYYSVSEIHKRAEDIAGLKGNLVGDVAHYYLNYIHSLNTMLPQAKFIYLERDIEETVASFMKKSGNWCHWIPEYSPVFMENNYKAIDWDRTFPDYPYAKSKEDAIRKYVISYHEQANKLCEIYSDKMLKIKTKDLCKEDTLNKIFNFLEIPLNDRCYDSVWENKNE